MAQALNLSNISTAVTDRVLGKLGRRVGRQLQDLCLYGCYRVTDGGLMHVAHGRMRHINFNGCYKVSDSGRRYLLSCNPHILIYNKPTQFGRWLTAKSESELLASYTTGGTWAQRNAHAQR